LVENVQDGETILALIVDDSIVQRTLLAKRITNWGFEVLQAESGEAALEICKSRDIDLILSDWMMPGMDGPSLCRAYRALDLHRYGYFILLTSRDTEADASVGLDSGADDFLTKPVGADELRSRLRAGRRIVEMQKQLVEKNHSISNALAELRQIHRAIDRDLEEARKLQQSLLPVRALTAGAISVSLALEPSGHVGGDMVGKYMETSDKIGIFAFDVSGHGISSALVSTRMAALLTSRDPAFSIAMKRDVDGSHKACAPMEIAQRLNERMADEFDSDHYVTLLLMEIDTRTGQVGIVQCGHPHPVLMRADGSTSLVGDGGMPVGLLDDPDFGQYSVHLAPGDRLLAFSDGFSEAADPSGTMLTEEGVAALMNQSGDGGNLDTLIKDVRSFAAGGWLEDDLSAVLVSMQEPMALRLTG